MAGIYIHIPFCKTKCGYCDFYSNNQFQYKVRFIEALSKEIQDRASLFTDLTIDTIYFGGGTPSQLPIDDFKIIFKAIYGSYNVSALAEITLEANPDDLTFEYTNKLLSTGFNRISMGVQTFDNAGLHFMNRRHNANQAIDAVNMAKNAGFDNITIDLIYGYHGLTEEVWKKNLETAFTLPTKHLSAYHLIFEEGTPFHLQREKNQIKEVDEATSELHYGILCQMAKEAGFEHYEISNFSKNGWHSRHNSSYWQGIPYLGFGPSAHSFFQNQRWSNVSNTAKYSDLVLTDKNVRSIESLDIQSKLNERIMISLRTAKGLNLADFEKEFGSAQKEAFLEKCHKNTTIQLVNNTVSIHEKDWLISDSIIASLFA